MRLKLPLLCTALLLFPAAVLAQDAKAGVTAGSQAWEAGWNAGDAAAIAALYAEDAVIMPPGSEMVKGREAIQAFWQAAIEAAPGETSTLETLEVHSHGDMAVEIGTYANTGPGGEHVDHGKYVAVWMKIDGSWKLVRDIFNSSME
jgi:uncharacterized protein (TIGR02246 family)